jgi:hypothetical protein
MQVSLSPERLGAPTRIAISLRIAAIPPASASPVTNVGVLLPNETGIATSGLGLENCLRLRLEELGPEGCPSDALMGRGSASAEIPIGGEPVDESAQIDLFSAPVVDGRLAFMVYVNAESPVLAQLVFPATLIPAQPPYSEGIDSTVPLVPTLPGAPDVAIDRLQMMLGASTTGPDRFVYYRLGHGRRVAYVPRGLLLPPVCRRAGFPFEAKFTFADGTSATAEANVPCPHRR